MLKSLERLQIKWFKKQWFQYQWTLRTSAVGRGRIVERWKNVVENDGKYFD